VDGKCVVFVGALTAYDLASGEVKWEWTGGGTPYGSPVLMTVEGTKQVVTPTTEAVAGISLADGKLLWQGKHGGSPKDYQSNFSTPVIDGQTVIYSVASKGTTATMALKIEKKGDGFTAMELWKQKAAAHQYHTPVLKDGLLFGVSSPGRNFFCMDAKTGNVLWTDSTRRGDCGSILNAGSVLLALTSDMDLVAFKPSNKEYAELAKIKVADSPPWSVPIIAGKRVFVKDRDALTLWTIE
jgi:outer membrane protein assembly factor BamB